jgi:hypothetical protein
MYLEAIIEHIERCTWGPRSSEHREELGGQDRLNLEKHSKDMIEHVWRCPWRPCSSELRDALGGHDGASLEMHWEAVIE